LYNSLSNGSIVFSYQSLKVDNLLLYCFTFLVSFFFSAETNFLLICFFFEAYIFLILLISFLIKEIVLVDLVERLFLDDLDFTLDFGLATPILLITLAAIFSVVLLVL